MIVGGVHSAKAQGWTASEVGAGDFYLYNVAAGDFISNGANWGTHTVVSNTGWLVNLSLSDGKYVIGSNSKYSRKHLGYNCYADNGDANQLWIFEPVDGLTNTYKLKTTNNTYASVGAGKYYFAVGDDTGDSRSYWKLVTAANRADLSKASITNPIDVTYLLSNPDFDENADNWATAGRGGKTGNDGDMNPCSEKYNTTYDVYQTVTGLQNGIYGVRVQGFYRNGGFADAVTARTNGTEALNAIFYANSKETPLKSILEDAGKATGGGLVSSGTYSGIPNDMNAASYFFSAGLYQNVIYVEVTDGTLKIGIKKTASVGADWTIFDNFRLEYYGSETTVSALENQALIATYNEKLAEANDFDLTPKMEASVKAAFSQAIEDNTIDTNLATAEEINTAISNLNDAISSVTNSINAYTNTKAYLDKMGAVLEGTNVYTTTAYNAYYKDWLDGYNANTLATATAATLNANIAYSTGWHSNNYIDDILLSTWSIGGEQCSNYDKGLYINTWSTEGNTDGSEFLTPFFEYWTGDANSLGANTIQTQITGLQPDGTYSLTIRARVRQSDNKTKIANGITMKVGDGTPVDISSGAQFGTGQFYIGNFSAVGKADSEGKLTGTITVAENSNISWLSFYNVRYTEGEDLSAYIADYEFALNNVNTTLTNDAAIYSSMQSDLQNAADTYASVDTTNKAALIAAKEALEEALAAYNAIVAPLRGSSIIGWTTTGNNGTFEVNTWSTEGNSDGSNMKTPFIQNWIARGTNLTDATMSYTVNGLTPGYYRVTALVRSLNEAGGATPAGSFIFANDAIERAFNGTACTNGVYANPVVYGLVGDDGTLTFGVKVIKANVNWISFKNFTYTYEGTTLTSDIANNLTEEARSFDNLTTGAAATQTAAVNALAVLSDANYIAAGQAIEAAYKAIDRDFSTLNAAIDAKDGYVLGFEKDEYAPYSGVVAALATARAIDQESEATSQSDINAAATALDNITANTQEVNAIYWKTDYTAEDKAADGYVHPIGWTNTGYNTRIMCAANDATDNPAMTTIGTAVFSKYNTTYGETIGYTMPLKAGKIYKITFKHCGWGNNPTTNIVLTDPESNTIALAPGFRAATSDGNTDAEHWYDYTGYFVSTTAGDYVIAFNKVGGGQQQIAWADMQLVSATELPFADGSVPTYAPGTYPTVKIARTLTADRWATAVYPFAVTGVDKIAVLSGYNKETAALSFSTAAASTANEPFLMKSATAKSEITLSNVDVVAAAATDATAAEVSFKGVYASTEVDNSAKNYVLSANTIYPVGANNATILPYRAYLQVAQDAEARIQSFFVDDETTGISVIESEQSAQDGYYNLNGQRVNASAKGIFVKNGKKVINK